MLRFDDKAVRELLFNGKTGLEKESLRVTEDGFFAMTPHPFPNDECIVRDFCENQIEINTPPLDSPEEAVDSLLYYTRKIKKKLAELEEPEYLWGFSNPPYIRKEDDIPIAKFEGAESYKTEYRNYLANRYGRYKMTFSGIHFNYSFSDELLKRSAKVSGADDWKSFKDQFYVDLAAKTQEYNWIVVAVTAASPLMDSSYFEKGGYGTDVFNGMGSTRCSEMGYWNFFTPIIDYSNIISYADSIERYVKQGLIRSTAELYFPVRLKPKGEYSIDALRKDGVNHIELRMIDLNPLTEAGIEKSDVEFLQLLLIYLACVDNIDFDADTQMLSIANTKNAARFDLKTVNLTDRRGRTVNLVEAAIELLQRMRRFFAIIDKKTLPVIDFQMDKFSERKNRYTWKVKDLYSNGFVEKGLAEGHWQR